MPYGSMMHIPPTNYHLPAAKQKPYQKAYLLTKNVEEFSGEKSQENAPVGERERKKEKTERAMGAGRRTREEIVKWHQMTGLRLRTRGDIRHPRHPSRGT